MKTLTIATVLLALAGGTDVLAQEKYRLKLQTIAAAGAPTETTDTFEGRMMVKVFDAQGTLIGTKRGRDSREVKYRETRLDAGRLTREYLVALESTDHGTKMLPTAGEKLTFSLAPSVRLISKPVNRELTAEKVADLEESLQQTVAMGKRNVCLPPHAVAVGEQWTLSSKDASVCFNPFDGDEKRARATGTLSSVDDVNGQKFATVEFNAVVMVSAIGKEVTFKSDGELAQKLIVRFPITERGASSAQVHYEGTLSGTAAPDARGSMKLTLNIKGDSQTAPVKK